MPAATDIMTPLWRGVVVLRIVTAAFAVGAIIVHHDGFARPDLGWVVLAGIVVWTVVTCLAYSFDVTRRIHMIVLDLVVTLALMASSVLVLSPDQLAEVTERTPLLTTVWACGPVVAAAVHAGRIAGVLFGVAVSAVNVWARGFVTTDIAWDTMLLVGAGFVLGLAATTARRAAEQLRRAARAEAAAAEREIALRSLISAAPSGAATSGEEDLASALQPLANPRVDVAVPTTEVPLPASDVEELVAVTRDALASTVRHGGSDAKAWVLVADLGEEVVLTIRAEGPGLDDAQLADAGANGRVSRSIGGRVADLGGILTLRPRPGHGTEWEVRLARTRCESPQ